MPYSLDDAELEVLRQTERQLEAQHSLAIAADQRALTYCAVIFVVVVLVLEGVSQEKTGGILVISLLLASAALAAYSAKPTRFYGSGGEAGGLEPYLNTHHFALLPKALRNRNDECLRRNEKTIKDAALLFKVAMLLGFLGITLIYMEAIGVFEVIRDQRVVPE